MKISVKKLDIPGLLLIKNEVFEDKRGFFKEVYRENLFKEFENLNLPSMFVQLNHSSSTKNVLRGLHFQYDPPMAKMMRVIKGSAFLVAVDIRKSSATLGKWFGITLTEKDHTQIYAPAGFARGFCVLSDIAEMEYLCTRTYNKDGEYGILWNDPQIGIKWPVIDPLISDKDSNAQTLNDWLKKPESDNFNP